MKKKAPQEININTADLDELMKISGIGPERSQFIINFRDENGPFESWEDVKNMPGFSDHSIDLMKSSGMVIKSSGLTTEKGFFHGFNSKVKSWFKRFQQSV